MASFVVAGVMSDTQLVKAEALAAHLQLNLPSYKVSVERVPQAEWAGFLGRQMRNFGWKTCDPAGEASASAPRGAPSPTAKIKETGLFPEGRIGGRAMPDERVWGNTCVWRESGELIGDAEDFIDLMAHAYNQRVDLDDELLESVARENLAEGMRQIRKERELRERAPAEAEEEEEERKAAAEAAELAARGADSSTRKTTSSSRSRRPAGDPRPLRSADSRTLLPSVDAEGPTVEAAAPPPAATEPGAAPGATAAAGARTEAAAA